MANGNKNRDMRRKKKKMAVVDDEKGIQLVVDLTMYSAETRDVPSKQVCDSKMSIFEQLATMRRSTRKEMPTLKALEAIVDSRANKRNKKDKE